MRVTYRTYRLVGLLEEFVNSLSSLFIWTNNYVEIRVFYFQKFLLLIVVVATDLIPVSLNCVVECLVRTMTASQAVIQLCSLPA